MFTAILTIPTLVLPLLGAPTRDCQFDRLGDPAADAMAISAFEARVRNYITLHRRDLGSFFTPDVATAFRERIAETAREQSIVLDEEDMERWWMPAVGAPLPWDGLGAASPLFDRLPALPPEIEYRLIGRDLVLHDVRANVVMDVLAGAVPFWVYEAPIPVAPEDDAAAPSLYETEGCLYGDSPDA